MRSIIAGLVAAAALTLAAPAAAATVTIPNACYWSIPGGWEQENLTFAATASPERAGAGAPVTLGGVSVRTVLPSEVVQAGYSFGVLKPGVNDIPIRAWIALRGANTAEGVQVRETTALARTTIATTPELEFVSATPIDVQASLPDSQWTTGAVFPTTFTQAEAGTLPDLPIGRSGGLVKPLGSAVITATIGPSTLQLDCQPGARSADRTGPVPAAGAPFASVVAPDAAPIVTPSTPKPALTLRSTKLRDDKGRVALKLSCAAAPCAGAISVQTASKVRVGKRKLIVAVTRATRYTLAPGASRTLKLKLTAAARKLLRERKLTVRVTTAPTAGEPLARKLSLAGRRATR